MRGGAGSGTRADLYLVDSSAWIPTLRPSPVRTALQGRVSALLAANGVATTGMIRMELLRGTRDYQQFEQLRAMLDGLHQLPTDEATWDAAAELGRTLRLAGIVAQSTDLLIATVALRAGAILLHRDSDFGLIAQHVPLKTESFL